MEDYQSELLVKQGHLPIKHSGLSLNDGDDLISIKTDHTVTPGPENGADHVERKWLSESRELVPSYQLYDSSRSNGTASSSNRDQPFPYCVSENELFCMDAITVEDYNGPGEPLLDEVSVENNASEEVDFSNSDFGSSSFVSDSPLELRLLRDDTLQGPGLGFLVSEREQNREDGSLLHVNMMNVSSNNLPTNTAEITSWEGMRNSRRLFWDAFSRASSGRHTDSTASAFSPVDSHSLGTHDRRLIGFSSDLSSQGSRTPSINEQQLNSRSEVRTFFFPFKEGYSKNIQIELAHSSFK